MSVAGAALAVVGCWTAAVAAICWLGRRHPAPPLTEPTPGPAAVDALELWYALPARTPDHERTDT